MDGRLYKGEIMNFYKKKTFKDIAYYSFATYLYTAFNSVSNLFISKILGPTSLGVINYFNAIDSNVNNVLYGTVRSAVEREVPQIKDPEEKAVYIEKSLTLNFILLLLVSFVYLTIAIFSEDNLIRYSASTVAVLNLIKGGTDFYKSWHKSLDHIRSVSLVMIFSALLIPVFVILFSHVWGLEGFWYGRIVVQGLTFIVYFYLLHFVFTLKNITRIYSLCIEIRWNSCFIFSDRFPVSNDGQICNKGSTGSGSPWFLFFRSYGFQHVDAYSYICNRSDFPEIYGDGRNVT